MSVIEILRYLPAYTWNNTFLCLFIVILSWLFYTLIVKPLSHPLARQLPGPRFVPFIGNVREIMTNDTTTTVIRWAAKYGHMMRYFSVFGEVKLLLVSPEAFKHVLVTNCKNYRKNKYAMRLIRRMLGNGLLTSEGSVHALHRKLVSPAFGTSAITEMIPKFTMKALELSDFWADQLKNHGNGDWKTTFNIAEDFARMTLDVIGECAMSYEFKSLRHPDHEIAHAFRNVVSCLSVGFDIFLPKFHLWPTKRNRAINKYMEVINGVMNNIIKEKEKKFATARNSDELEALQKDLLAMLMSARDDGSGHGLSDEELRDHVITFVAAGHETTTHALTWLFLHLAQNVESQEKLREEVLSYLADDEESISMETLDKMEYLNAVVKETLRLTPPGVAVSREALQDDVICGHFVPAGTSCHIAIGSAMRLPEYWDDPETFKPERFINNDNINPYCWVPFVLGNRMCIGYRFALLEMKTITAILIKRFRFSWVPGYKFRCKLSITMRPDPPLELFVEPV